ncbi:MAG TPA: hypothetical protein ENJ95_11510 [Bacteroidetes bacterium]|nr:hypothetical protein [Bacteroidota bacterium]
MQDQLKDILERNEKKYVQILRLLHLIEGVNKSIENSREMESTTMLKQYKHLKSQYTKEFLTLLAEFKMPIQLAKAA